MRLLIVTQKIDERDPVLGFMCGWIRAFANAFEKLTVICLERGAGEFPPNVRVFSLGKEKAAAGRGGRPPGVFAKLRYTRNFLRYIVKFRNDYDGVFVHMNPEYVILGGLFWRLWRKKIVLWYNHQSGGAKLAVAAALSNVVCHTSPFAASANFSNSRIMPVGVDTDLFKPAGGAAPRPAAPHRLLSLGRIAPIKDLDVMIDAVSRLLDEGEDIEFSVVGDALPRDADYLSRLKERAAKPVYAGRIIFREGEGDRKNVAEFFRQNEFFLNASPAGLFDKTVFEAMACGCVPLVSSKAFAGILPPECLFNEGNSQNLAYHLVAFFHRSSEELERLGGVLRNQAVAEHSLESLASHLKSLFGTETL